MHSETKKRSLIDSLTEQIDKLPHGARLPTVRELMREFGVGQATVQSALANLKQRGVITAAVGRGTYVVKSEDDPAETPASDLRSLLIVSNSSMNDRCLSVQNALVNKVRKIGGKVVQISYHDTDYLLRLLEPVPVFDAIVLQSHYESIPIRLFSLLQSKARAVVVDGHSVSGVDVDRMGIDWEDAMALALDYLVERGRRRIALVSLASNSQPLRIARRFFGRFGNWKGHDLDTRVELLDGPVHPSDSVSDALAKTLAKLDAGDSAPPDSVILLGVSDGAGVVSALNAHRRSRTGDLDLIVLGHTDVRSEHLGVLPIAGGRSSDGADELLRIVLERLRTPGMPPQVVYIPTEVVHP